MVSAVSAVGILLPAEKGGSNFRVPLSPDFKEKEEEMGSAVPVQGYFLCPY